MVVESYLGAWIVFVFNEDKQIQKHCGRGCTKSFLETKHVHTDCNVWRPKLFSLVLNPPECGWYNECGRSSAKVLKCS